MEIAYLGPEGSYTEEALRNYNSDCKMISLPNISLVFQAVASKQVDLGIVPFENSIEGRVIQTLDSLLKYYSNIHIVDTTVLNIQHSLGALPKHSKIERIISKDTALAQCSNYIKREYPNAELISSESTSGAMKLISEQKMIDGASIGLSSSFNKYGLEVLADNIGNSQNNKTKFIVFEYNKSNK